MRETTLCCLVLLLVIACSEQVPTSVPTPAPTPTPTPTPMPLLETDKVESSVLRVIDGDTIEVDIEGELYTVRYVGIDTPETKHPQVGVGCFGPEATERNRELVEGQTVYLEKDVSETDRYGRLLKYVWLPDGRMINGILVAEGYAQVTPRQR